MKKLNKEILKSLILLILILASTIQIGILWSLQSPRFPISILTRFFDTINENTYQAKPKESMELYFNPTRIIVSEGKEQTKWAILKGNLTYGELWNEVKNNYIKTILDRKPDKILQTNDEWVNLIDKKGISFEFNTLFTTKVVEWFYGIETNSEIKGIQKIAIFPWEDINSSIITVYLDDGSKIYKYLIKIDQKKSKEYYSKIIERLNRNNTLIRYSVVKDKFPSSFPIKQDILITGGLKSESIKDIYCFIPEKIRIDKIENLKEKDIDSLSYEILKNEQLSYIPAQDLDKTIVFKDVENIYRIYNNGVLEYKYLPKVQEIDKGKLKDSFIKVLDFIKKRNDLISGVDIDLAQINSQKKDRYVFTFDYSINGYPIKMSLFNKSNNNISNAIVIEANSNRVLSCTWVIRNVELDKEYKKYDIEFTNFLNYFNQTYKAENLNFYIENIRIGYVVSSNGLSYESNSPKWILKTPKRYYTLPMKEKGD